ncbi:MAG: DUF1385 domain-containing protein [Clostridia bacterium]|nr:DUF1385 domain-containing protein [Clostridia bacterium]
MSKKTCAPSCVRKTSIGGQALLEGIMMRGPKRSAMAVRNPEKQIVLETWENKADRRPKILRLPIIRGVYSFIDSMASGYKCLMRSAAIAGLEEEEPKPKKKKKSKAEQSTDVRETVAVHGSADSEQTQESVTEEAEPKKEKKDEEIKPWVFNVIMVVATVLGVALAIGLFFFVPSLLYRLLLQNTVETHVLSVPLRSLIKSAFEGILKILLLVIYMSLVSLMKDIRRTFQYHGAEHKTIFCFEHGKKLTVENVRGERRFHPRCGTSFLILMLIVSIFLSFLIDPLFYLAQGHTPSLLVRTVLRLLLLPVMMGLGYELIRLAGRHDNWFTRIISAPGMWLQHITVLEPEDDMIECAIAAFLEVLPEEDRAQAAPDPEPPAPTEAETE